MVANELLERCHAQTGGPTTAFVVVSLSGFNTWIKSTIANVNRRQRSAAACICERVWAALLV